MRSPNGTGASGTVVLASRSTFRVDLRHRRAVNEIHFKHRSHGLANNRC